MVATMEAMPGVGLAAPQIGAMVRLAVVDASSERGQVVRLANPVVVGSEGAPELGLEASPCLPGLSAKVPRPPVVMVRFLDAAGAEIERRFEGLWARSLLHQIDHLDGRLFVDRLSRTRRDMLLRRFAKAGRKP